MFCQTRDHKKVYYEVHGPENAPVTLVFLNGLTQSTLSWFFFLPYFKDRYRIVLLDQVFQGQSDKEGEWRDFDRHAEDVMCVLEHERINKVILIGISYGSLVAQHFALLFPSFVHNMVLLSTFAHKTPYFEAIGLSWTRALETGGYHLLLDVMLPNVLSEDYFDHPVIPIEAMKEARKGVNENTAAILNLMKATAERGDHRAALGGIRCKVLVIHGEKDLLIPLHMGKEVYTHLPNAQWLVIQNAGHTLNLEKVHEVCTAILEFIGK